MSKRGGTNRIKNPSFETNGALWSTQVGTVISRDTAEAWSGSASGRVDVTTALNATCYTLADQTGITLIGVPHLITAKLRVKGPAGIVLAQSARIIVNYTAGNSTTTLLSNVVLTGVWQELTAPPLVTDDTRTISAIVLYAHVAGVAPPAPFSFYVDGADLRIDEPDCDTYIDGSLGAGYAWTGVAHATTSVRSPVIVTEDVTTATRGGTNWVPNPSAEVNMTNITTTYAGSASSRTTEHAVFGTACVKVVSHATTVNNGVYWTLPLTGIVLTGVVHQVRTRFRIWVNVGDSLSFQQYNSYSDATTWAATIVPITGTGEWQTITVTSPLSDPAKTINLIRPYFYQNPAKCIVYYIDGLDVRLDEPDVDSFIDGSLGSRFAWSGAAHNSPSSRALVPRALPVRAATRGGMNVILNPSVETNITGWTARAGSQAIRSTDLAWIGGASLKVVPNITAVQQGAYYQLSPPAGLAVTGVAHFLNAKVRLWIPTGMTVPNLQVQVNYTDLTTTLQAVTNIVGTGDWQEVTLPTVVTDSTKTIQLFYVQLFSSSLPAASQYLCYVDAVDLRIDEPDVVEYIDGSLGPDYAWTGVAHASASTRAMLPIAYLPTPPSRGGRNRLRNPSAETNATSVGAAAGGLVVRSTDLAWVGGASFKATLSAASGAQVYQGADLTGITTTVDPHLVAAKVRVWAASGAALPTALLRVNYTVAPPQDVTVSGLLGNGDWQEIELPVIATDPTRVISSIYSYLYNATAAAAPALFYIDGWDVRIDEPDCDDYVDGSLGLRYAWTGTAHASMGTRLGQPLPAPRDPFAVTAAKNWIANPSVEVKADDIGLQGSAKQAMTADAAVYGTKSLKVITHPTAAYSGPYFPGSMAGIGAGAHTLRMRCMLLLGAGVVHPGVRLQATFLGTNVPAEYVVQPVTGTGEWQQVELSLVTSASKSLAGVAVILNVGATPRSLVFFVDGVDLRVDGPMDGYFDGSLGLRYAWTGTPHNSPSTRTAIPMALPLRPKTGPITLSPELWRATKDGARTEDLSALVLNGKIQWDADRSGDSGGTALSAQFRLRQPVKLTPFVDYLMPFLTVSYASGETVTQQLGLFALDIPDTDYWLSEAQSTLRGKDLTWVMRQSVLSRTLNIASGTQFDTALRQQVTGAGLSRHAIISSARTLGYHRSMVPGLSRLEVFNKLAGAIGWYPAYMDLSGKIRSGPYLDIANTLPSDAITPDEIIDVVQATPQATGVGNVCVVVKDNPGKPPLTWTQKNNDPRSPISIPNLDGQEIMIEGHPIRNSDLENLGDLGAYAKYKVDLGATFTNVLKLTVIPDPSQGIYRTVDLVMTSGSEDLSGRYWLKAWEVGFTAADGPTTMVLSRVVSFAEVAT